MYEESQSRVNELTTINVNLSASRAKIEQELAAIASDYEEVTKELKVQISDHAQFFFFNFWRYTIKNNTTKSTKCIDFNSFISVV